MATDLPYIIDSPEVRWGSSAYHCPPAKRETNGYRNFLICHYPVGLEQVDAQDHLQSDDEDDYGTGNGKGTNVQSDEFETISCKQKASSAHRQTGWCSQDENAPVCSWW